MATDGSGVDTGYCVTLHMPDGTFSQMEIQVLYFIPSFSYCDTGYCALYTCLMVHLTDGNTGVKLYSFSYCDTGYCVTLHMPDGTISQMEVQVLYFIVSLTVIQDTV